MQLKISTDYAIRSILYLAAHPRGASCKEISMEFEIPQKYLMKILGEMKRAGLLSSRLGVDGGFCLNRHPEEVTLYDIISIMEGSIVINRCLEPRRFCSGEEQVICPIYAEYEKMQISLEKVMRGTTVASLVKRQKKAAPPPHGKAEA